MQISREVVFNAHVHQLTVYMCPFNAKSHAREKPLLAGYSKTSPVTVSSRNAPMNEALCDDTKIGVAREDKKNSILKILTQIKWKTQ